MDKALLVGINAYPSSPLNGCVNDINDMENFVHLSCGFASSSFKKLVDGAATTQAILDGLVWLVKGAQSGDRLLFHYSGHGVQVTTRDKKGELDGLDECVCSYDFNWEEKYLIRDKQFRAIFSGLPAGVKFVWVSDSCHSQGLSKIMPKPRTLVKSMPVPVHLMPDLARARVLPRKKVTYIPFNGALISGCRSNQTSADAFFGSRYNGALTRFLLAELKRTPRAKLLDVMPRVAKALKDGGYSQVPGLEGSAVAENLAFLGTE